jgi:hypothetical protein
MSASEIIFFIFSVAALLTGIVFAGDAAINYIRSKIK